MDNKKMLVQLGTALAASRVVKTISHLDLEDVLGTVGLARRRSHAVENLALVGLGAIIGAGAALLLAPSSGREVRERIGSEASKLGQVAVDAVREHKDDALRALSNVANGAVSEPS